MKFRYRIGIQNYRIQWKTWQTDRKNKTCKYLIYRFLIEFGGYVAERKGFEPPVRCRTHAFQACSLNHSDTSLYNVDFKNGARI